MRKFKVTVNGNTYEVAVEEMSTSANVMASVPVAAPAPISTPMPAAPVAPAPAAPAPAPVKKLNIPTNGTQLKAPMPGTILKIAAQSGTTVKKGDVVVVLEAMKMENDIVSPADGVVNISISQGQNVNSGDVIAIIG